MLLRVIPAIISYKSFPWIKVALRSFRRHFPLVPVLIIDNNPDDGDDDLRVRVSQERTWLTEWVYTDFNSILLKRDEIPKRHGMALDFVRKWCFDHGVQYFIHMEPDCLVCGCQWAQALLTAVKAGAWMAGMNGKRYGPIHPTPSIWDVFHIKSTFETYERTEEKKHPRYHEVFHDDILKEDVTAGDPTAWWWWENNWDTAQRAWFYMAVEDRARMVSNPGDFEHFWQGSSKNTDPTKCVDRRVLEYLY